MCVCVSAQGVDNSKLHTKRVRVCVCVSGGVYEDRILYIKRIVCLHLLGSAELTVILSQRCVGIDKKKKQPFS